MKRSILTLLLVFLIPASVFVLAPPAGAIEAGISSSGMTTTKVQQMGMGDLDMVTFDEPQEVNTLTFGGNFAGFIWDEPFSSLEGTFSYGSGSYTSEYGDKSSWSYMGNGYPLYRGFPIMEALFSVFSRGGALPAPGIALSLRKQSNVFFLSGEYARDAYKNEYAGYVSESVYSSPQFAFGVSTLTAPDVSFGLAFDYIPTKERYTYSSSGGSSSDEESHSHFGGQIGICRSRKSSGSFRTSTGGEFKYISVNEYDDRTTYWGVGIEHVGGFSVGYGTVLVRAGHLDFEGSEGMTDIEVGGRVFFQAPQSPLLFTLGLNRISLSGEGASPDQTTFSGGFGISVPTVLAGFEYVNNSFNECGITKIEALKIGSEFRYLNPIILRIGFKKTTTGGYTEIKEGNITAGIGFCNAPDNLTFDLAYNNSRENLPLTYYEEVWVTDHIFALSLKKGF